MRAGSAILHLSTKTKRPGYWQGCRQEIGRGKKARLSHAPVPRTVAVVSGWPESNVRKKSRDRANYRGALQGLLRRRP